MKKLVSCFIKKVMLGFNSIFKKKRVRRIAQFILNKKWSRLENSLSLC